ncbi:MAG: carboxylesterase family protein [Desulfobacteraceae bacterium]|nr:carboxylesterase family protein [Desulfobacteraceae bacterium]
MKRKAFKTLRCLAVMIVLLLGFISIIGTGDDDEKDWSLLRSTEQGVVKGHLDEDADVMAWQGIPFAKPPVGDLRWKAPQDPEPWSGKLEATQSGPPSLQFEMDRTWHQTGNIIGSEDCLYLDIYRPDSEETDLPVYFWIHGGSNRFGGAAQYAEHGKSMANELNVVVVITQYRLGPFGWFRHVDMRDGDVENYSNSGNFGTLDQIKALEWVQNNISEFGGNPNNVTIAGQSAGGHNVMNLVISPLAEGLFHKAVCQSGIMPVVEPTDTNAETIISNLGIVSDNPADELRNAGAEQILAAGATIQTFNAFADGYVIPDTVVNAVYQGDYNSVPIIVGVNHNEWFDFLPLYGPQLGKPLWGNVYDLFDPNFDPEHEWTYAEIFPNENEEALYQAAGRYPSMGYRAKYLDELASYLSEQQEEVYGYRFDWAGGGVAEMEDFAKVFGAAHSMEIPFFFGLDDSLFGYSFIPENEAGRKDLQNAMQTYLHNFMTTGDPGFADDGTPWDPWSNEVGAIKAITFNADANEAILGYITDELTFEEVNNALTAELASWPEAFRDAWGWLPASMTTQEPESIRFSHLLDFEAQEGAEAYSGTYGYDVDQWSGYQIAGHRLEIPEGWDPATDGLVLYCHGYRGDVPQLSISNAQPLRQYLISMGYAWAASSYSENGYNIATGVIGTRVLLDLIEAELGEMPDPVYIIGHSMGGHITARSVTEYPDAYDGAMPMCGVVGGAIEQFSSSLDWTLLANYFSELNYSLPFALADAGVFLETVFGPVINEDGDRSGEGAFGYIPPLGPSYYEGREAILNGTGETFKDATMYRTGGERPMYDLAFANMAYFQTAQQGLSFAMDPTSGGGRGIVVDNWDRTYQLDGDPGQTQEELDLNNGIARIALDGEFDFEDVMFPVHGDITIPVLSMHDIGDYFVPFEHERIYAGKVADAGNSNLLRTRIYRSIDHCGFTPQETIQAFADLAAWVEGGIVPEGNNVLDPAQVAADDYGCQFTLQQRPADQYTDGEGTWICDQ